MTCAQARASGIAATGISFPTIQSGANTYAWNAQHAEIKNQWQKKPSYITSEKEVYFKDVKAFLGGLTPESYENGISSSGYSYEELRKISGFNLPNPEDAYEKVESSGTTLATYETNLDTLASECAKREADEEIQNSFCESGFKCRFIGIIHLNFLCATGTQ